MRILRLYVVDRQALVRAALRQLLSSERGLAVAGEARDGAGLLQLLAASLPDLVLLEAQMPGLSGADLIALLRSRHPTVPVLVLSMHIEPRVVRQALRAGARGYVTKGSGPEILFRAVRAVAAGGRFIEPQLSESIAFQGALPEAQPTLNVLTRRELEVLQGLVEGSSLNGIAARLGISSKTVSTHKAKLMQKMEFRSNADMVRFALASGLIEASASNTSGFP